MCGEPGPLSSEVEAWPSGVRAKVKDTDLGSDVCVCVMVCVYCAETYTDINTPVSLKDERTSIHFCPVIMTLSWCFCGLERPLAAANGNASLFQTGLNSTLTRARAGKQAQSAQRLQFKSIFTGFMENLERFTFGGMLLSSWEAVHLGAHAGWLGGVRGWGVNWQGAWHRSGQPDDSVAPHWVTQCDSRDMSGKAELQLRLPSNH